MPVLVLLLARFYLNALLFMAYFWVFAVLAVHNVLYCFSDYVAYIYHFFVALSQFKVLQSGFWGNINFARHESQLKKAKGTGVILANPWIRHFRSLQRKQVVISSTLQEKSTFGSLAVRVSGKMALTSAALASNLEQLPASHSNLSHFDDPVDSSNTGSSRKYFVVFPVLLYFLAYLPLLFFHSCAHSFSCLSCILFSS